MHTWSISNTCVHKSCKYAIFSFKLTEIMYILLYGFLGTKLEASPNLLVIVMYLYWM